MQKDIIYIDVEDDITAIISKVKDSRDKVIALVPPKRMGVLQSAVNLRLLQRAASQSDKKLAIITNNPALSSLAAAANIPIAKNLQSQPELGEVAVLDVDDGNDVIDGADLPVGEHARMSDDELEAAPVAASAASASSIIDDDGPKNIQKAPAPALSAAPKKPKAKNGPKVPNFDRFRKKMFLIIAAGVLLLAFLIWVLFFAAHATVVISAKTTEVGVNDSVTISPSANTDAAQKTIKGSVQTIQKDVSQTFPATGQKNVGQKATGRVNFTNNTQNDVKVPSGTNLTSSSGAVYVLNSDVTIPGGKVVCNPFPRCHGATNSQNGNVTAKNPGANYNAAEGNLSGVPSGIAATFSGPTSGGTDQIVKVVTADDIAGAKNQITSANTDAIQNQLSDKFGKNVNVLRETFQTTDQNLNSSPAQDAEADSGQATLSGTITYTMMGVDNNEVSNYLNNYFQSQLDSQKNQRVYENGAKQAKFNNVSADSDSVKAQLSANGKIGPSINDRDVKELSKGKRLGDIQSSLQQVQGVQSVDVKYWPFWVSTAPNDTKRINVEFNLSGK